ncbi:helix-turn-helix domain-containing protein [Rhodococcus sp. NPDC055024]
MPETGTNHIDPEELRIAYSDKTLAAALGVSKDMVFKARHAGQLKAYKIGGCVRILREDAHEWYTATPWEPSAA